MPQCFYLHISGISSFAWHQAENEKPGLSQVYFMCLDLISCSCMVIN